MLSDMTHVDCQKDVSPCLFFQQILIIFFSHVKVVGELERSCTSGGAGNRTYRNSKALWLLFGMEALPVMVSLLWSVSVTRAHDCCLRKVGELSPNALFCLLAVATGRIFFFFLGKFLLS